MSRVLAPRSGALERGGAVHKSWSKVIIPEPVRKKLDRFPSSLTDRIVEALTVLESKPRPLDPGSVSGAAMSAILPPLRRHAVIPLTLGVARLFNARATLHVAAR